MIIVLMFKTKLLQISVSRVHLEERAWNLHVLIAANRAHHANLRCNSLNLNLGRIFQRRRQLSLWQPSIDRHRAAAAHRKKAAAPHRASVLPAGRNRARVASTVPVREVM